MIDTVASGPASGSAPGRPLLLSVGSVNADFQARVTRPPATGETVMASDVLRLGGGKAANVALLARRLEVAAAVFARVGEDDLAAQALAPLGAAGVDLRGVAAVPGQATAVSMISVAADGTKGIVLAGNANEAWGPEGALPDLDRAIADAAAGSVLVADAEIAPWVTARAVSRAAARGLVTVLDPSPADRIETAWFDRVTLLTPNTAEAERLTGIAVTDRDCALRAARQLADRGVCGVAVKLGDGGCVLLWHGHAQLAPGLGTRPVDTTSAGDAFAGAAAVALLEGCPPVEAACWAVAAADLAVRTYGSAPDYPGRGEVLEVVRVLRRQVRAPRRRRQVRVPRRRRQVRAPRRRPRPVRQGRPQRRLPPRPHRWHRPAPAPSP